MDEIPLEDALDHNILMHRNVHFAGSFPLMLSYYAGEGKGVMSEFDLERIEYLANMEVASKTDLAEVYLDETEHQEVTRAKEKYALLKEAYDKETPDTIPCLIADLILSEHETPEQEIAALKNKGKDAVPALIDLLNNKDFYDPLFPGYGYAPAAAARCLGLIGDDRAIAPLFEAMGNEDFFTDEMILDSLSAFGKKAQDFLLKRLLSIPITKDNEHAVIALARFSNPEVASASLEVLQKIDKKKSPSFATYLVLCCTDLSSPAERAQLKKIAEERGLPPEVREEIESLVRRWTI